MPISKCPGCGYEWISTAKTEKCPRCFYELTDNTKQNNPKTKEIIKFDKDDKDLANINKMPCRFCGNTEKQRWYCQKEKIIYCENCKDIAKHFHSYNFGECIHKPIE